MSLEPFSLTSCTWCVGQGLVSLYNKEACIIESQVDSMVVLLAVGVGGGVSGLRLNSFLPLLTHDSDAVET